MKTAIRYPILNNLDILKHQGFIVCRVRYSKNVFTSIVGMPEYLWN